MKTKTLPEVRFQIFMRDMERQGKTPTLEDAYEYGYRQGSRVGRRAEQLRAEMGLSPTALDSEDETP